MAGRDAIQNLVAGYFAVHPANLDPEQLGGDERNELELHRRFIGPTDIETGDRVPQFAQLPRTGEIVARGSEAHRVARLEWIEDLTAAGKIVPAGKISDAREAAARGVIRVAAGEITAGPEDETITRPVMMPDGTIEAIGVFRQRKWRTAGEVNTLARFAETIKRAADSTEGYAQVTVRFYDPQGRTLFRTIPTPEGEKPSLLELVLKMEKFGREGAVKQSDEILTTFEPQLDSFEIGYVNPIRAAGKLKFDMSTKARIHPHFILRDLTTPKSNKFDCFLCVLRAVARANGAPVAKQNRTIRKELELGDEAIKLDEATVDKLARVFGLRVRVITGLTTLPDEEREFVDCKEATDPAQRYRCTTKPILDVMFQGGDENAFECNVYYDKGHAEYIEKFIAPAVCPHTGDLLSGEATPAERWKEARNRICAQGRRLWSDCDMDKITLKSSRSVYEDRVLVYDYETAYNHKTGRLEPYALGWMELGPKELALNREGAGAVGEFAELGHLVGMKIRGPRESAFSVSEELIRKIKTVAPKIRYTLVSFNGSRFDHYLLCSALLANGCFGQVDVFATAAGGIRQLRIGRRHRSTDLAKFIPGTSLADCCEGFDTSPVKLAGFSHREVQSAFERGVFYTEWLKKNGVLLSEYLSRDILCTASLYCKVRDSVMKITGRDILDPDAPSTVGGLAYDEMKVLCRLPKAAPTIEEDAWIRGGITGGRVEVFGNEGKAHKVVAKQLFMGDVVSEYPTVMEVPEKCAALFDESAKWGCYPTADSPQPEEVTEYTPGDVGLYEVEILQQPPGLPNIMPRKAEECPLDWHYRGAIECKVTHIEISLIRKHGGEVRVKRGLRYKNTSSGLFSPFVKRLAEMKNEQDMYKKTGDKRYNPALRSMIKLMMNAASGKCCQRNYDEVTVMASGESHQTKALKKFDRSKPITRIPIGAETIVMLGTKPEVAIYSQKKAKPAILAVFIYSYARAYLWSTLLQHNSLYTDTDSALFRAEDWAAFKLHFPQLIPDGRPKELGDIEEELIPGVKEVYESVIKDANKTLKTAKEDDRAALLEIIATNSEKLRMLPETLKNGSWTAYLNNAKDYGIQFRSESNELIYQKIRIKGIHQDSDRLVKSAEAAAKLEKMSLQQLAAEYHGEVPGTESMTISLTGNSTEFFENHLSGPVWILCSQIGRSYKDSSAPFSLVQRFIIKKLEGQIAPETEPEADEEESETSG